MRELLLRGAIKLPLSGIDGLSESISLKSWFESMWHAYLVKGTKGTISLPYWAKRVNNPKLFASVMKVLSEAGWVTSIALPKNNWGECYLNESKLLQYVSEDELHQIRMNYKWNHFTLTDKPVTKPIGKRSKYGLSRPGFDMAGNVLFQFDTDTMQAHYGTVIQLLNKGIDKSIEKYPHILDDLVNYANIGYEVLDSYISNPSAQYCSGNPNDEPRGRNNAGYLNKIGNPVGYKVMRALLTIPEDKRNTATKQGLLNKYLFIAELSGYKSGTIYGKARYGKQCYKQWKLPEGLDEAPDAIWLERTYEDIDNYFANDNYQWQVPIEIDMSASVLGYIGLLLNHKPFMERCNMIGDRLNDAWGHNTITNRTQFKTIMRQCYGSTMSPAQMWSDMDIPFTSEEVVAFTEELTNGELAVANAFKDFIISNCKPAEHMNLQVWNDTTNTECNKWNHIGETTDVFDFYDTYTGSIRRIHNTTTVKVANLESFRRYFVTALIHGIDGQVMDNVMFQLLSNDTWAIDIHDAIICCAEDADYARELYAEQLETVHTNRNTILSEYFTSIGISGNKVTEWQDSVVSKVEPYTGSFNCNPMVMK